MDRMSLKKKALLIVALFVCVCSTQAQYPSWEDYPFLYKYRWDSVGVANNGDTCMVEDYITEKSRDNRPKEIAFYQHTDTPLRAVGIAWGYLPATIEHSYCLSLYESDLKTKLAETHSGHFSAYFYEWTSDTNYHLLDLPGKKTMHTNFILAIPIPQMFLKYAYFDTPVEVDGDFYLGFHEIYNSNNYTANFSYVHELHNAPYHIGNYPYKLRRDTGWEDDTLDRELPEIFLIIEPECRAVESISVTADSTGCIHAVWDSLPWQDLWVAHLEGPSGERYDTLDTTAHTYCGLNPNEHYELSIQARCYRPGGRTWAQWSPSVSLGRAGIPFVDGANAHLKVFPNPATGSLTVEGEGGRLQLIDLEGHEVISRDLPAGCQRSTLDVSALHRGVYILRLSTDTGTATQRVVLM